MQTIIERLHEIGLNNPPTADVYEQLLTKIDFKIDNSFLDFIKIHNGGDGFLGENKYISFWSIETILELNPYYENEVKCDLLLFFGSDGSNYGYAFDKQNSKIVGIDFLEISYENPDEIANNFIEFINYLYVS